MSEGPGRSAIRILMVEDSALDAELITLQLRRAGLPFTTERTWTEQGMRDALAAHEFDVILADHVLPGFSGDAALDRMMERYIRVHTAPGRSTLMKLRAA